MSAFTIAGILALWLAPPRTEAAGERRRRRAGAFHGCRLTGAPSDHSGPVLWTADGRILGPRDLPSLTLFVLESVMRFAPTAHLVKSAKAAGYVVRVVPKLPALPPPPSSSKGSDAPAARGRRQRGRRRRPRSARA